MALEHKMKIPLTAILICVMSCSCTVLNGPKRSHLSKELPYDPSFVTSGGVTLAEARTHMDKTVYPNVDFRNTPTEDALSWLVQHSSEYSPNPPWGQSISSLFDNDRRTTITLSATNMSFAEILNAICEQSGRAWGFRGSILMTFPDKMKPEF